MDYEQKYKDALENAQKELQCCGDLDCDAAKQIFRLFPELCESEDERIIREIISIVKCYRKSCITEGTHRFDDCISWLEKQGEQKPNDKVETDMKIIPEEKYKRYLTHCLKRPPSNVICECGEIVNVKYYPYFYDEKNNDVYFGSICPKCGELIITRE